MGHASIFSGEEGLEKLEALQTLLSFPLATQIDRERDEPTRRDAAEHVLARLAGAGEDHQQLLAVGGRVAAGAVHRQRRESIRTGRLLRRPRELVELDRLRVE